jgi:hypothetical protein
MVPKFAPFRQKSLGDCTRTLLPTQGLEHLPLQKRSRTQRDSWTPNTQRAKCPPGSVCSKSVEHLCGCPSIRGCNNPLVTWGVLGVNQSARIPHVFLRVFTLFITPGGLGRRPRTDSASPPYGLIPHTPLME